MTAADLKAAHVHDAQCLVLMSATLDLLTDCFFFSFGFVCFVLFLERDYGDAGESRGGRGRGTGGQA